MVNDTDSLLVFRMHRLKSQPNTLRGRCILFFAALDQKPIKRVLLYLFFSFIAMAHSIAFCAMVYACGEDNQCDIGKSKIMWPLILLSIYPIVFIPIIIAAMIRDIIFIKKDGIMAWHRDSFGVLLQRFFFAIFMMASLLTFNNQCLSKRGDDLSECLVHASIPLIFVLVIVTLKVLCLNQQRLILWTGFIVCLIAQMIIFSSVTGLVDRSKQKQAFLTKTDQPGMDKEMVQTLMFLPCVVFGLCIDGEVLLYSYNYKPVAFRDLPFKHCRTVMIAFGVLTTLATLAMYIFCILVFGNVVTDASFRTWVFICFIIKSVTWAPFLGHEIYDMFFEHIYHDVQFQLNVIKPGTNNSSSNQVKHADPLSSIESSRQPSKGVSKKQRLSAIQEDHNEALLEMSEDDVSGNKSANMGSSGANISGMTGSDVIFKKQNTGYFGVPSDRSRNVTSTMRDSDASAMTTNFLAPGFESLQIEKPKSQPKNNELLIVNENQDVKSITDGEGSQLPDRGDIMERELNLTEIENQIRRQNDNRSTTGSVILKNSSGNVIDQRDSELSPGRMLAGENPHHNSDPPFFGSLPEDKSKSQSQERNNGFQMSNTWLQKGATQSSDSTQLLIESDGSNKVGDRAIVTRDKAYTEQKNNISQLRGQLESEDNDGLNFEAKPEATNQAVFKSSDQDLEKGQKDTDNNSSMSLNPQSLENSARRMFDEDQ